MVFSFFLQPYVLCPMSESPPIPHLNRSIALVGMMGAGKSTVGRRLAKRLGATFYDSDDVIAARLGASIPDIFERSGEAFFREQEYRVLTELAQGTPSIIATGGGAFVQPDVRNMLLNHCLTVWLDAPAHVLVERVSQRPAKRPLLKGKDIAHLIPSLLTERTPAYQLAHLHIPCEKARHHKIVDAILDAMRESGSF